MWTWGVYLLPLRIRYTNVNLHYAQSSLQIDVFVVNFQRNFNEGILLNF